MSVVLSEHLPLLATAPDGIKKLRGLILALAVRGKLVPQNPNDQPASELLKLIAEERKRLEAEGVCKKAKPLPPVNRSEQPFVLPPNWEWCRLPDAADYRMGKTPPTKESTYWADNEIPWVSISDMVHGETVNVTSRTVSSIARDKVFKSDPAPAGTLLMSFKLTVGKIATLGVDAFHNEAIISIYPFRGISQDFLSHFLPIIALGGNSKNALMGNTLNSESLSLLAIPLPPFAEQQRIVAKVDELMALCDRLEAEQADSETDHARLVASLLGTLAQSPGADELAANWRRLAEHFGMLFASETGLATLKQAILQLAVMGRLVSQDSNDEPASKLLARISEERDRLTSEGALRKLNVPPPMEVDQKKDSLPVGWEWARLPAVCHVITDGEHITPSYSESGVPILSAKHLGTDALVFEDLKFLSPKVAEKCWSRCFPEERDLLVVSRGGGVGRTVISGAREYCLMGSVLLFKPSSLINERYLLAYLNSNEGNAKLRTTSGASAQQAIYIAHLKRDYVLPLPPLAEQHRIVTKVNELMALCDHLRADLVDSRSRQACLADTLIDAALDAA